MERNFCIFIFKEKEKRVQWRGFIAVLTNTASSYMKLRERHGTTLLLRLEGTKPADILISDFKPPEQWKHQLGLCEPLLKRSQRGHDCWLTRELDPGNQRLLISSSVLRMNILHHAHGESCSKDTALRVRCAWDHLVWMNASLNLVKVSFNLLRFSWASMTIYSFCDHPGKTSQ